MCVQNQGDPSGAACAFMIAPDHDIVREHVVIVI
jgi:hypothetical protein